MVFDKQEEYAILVLPGVSDSDEGSLLFHKGTGNFSGFVGHMFSVTITQLNCGMKVVWCAK